MVVFAWLIVAGIIGWLMSVTLRTEARPGTLQLVIGIACPLVVGMVLTPWPGASAFGNAAFGLALLSAPVLGALILAADGNRLRWQMTR